MKKLLKVMFALCVVLASGAVVEHKSVAHATEWTFSFFVANQNFTYE